MLTVLVCTCVAIAFIHLDILGVHFSDFGEDEEIPEYTYERHYCHGWPTAFLEHIDICKYGPNHLDEGPPFLDRVNPIKWTSHITNMGAAILDGFLHLILIAATAVVVLRLERRGWARVQFSIADMLSLIATVSMVLGLICFDDRLSIGKDSAVEGMFLRLRDLPPFDRVMVLFAIACAVWLIVSTAMERSGGKRDKDRS